MCEMVATKKEEKIQHRFTNKCLGCALCIILVLKEVHFNTCSLGLQIIVQDFQGTFYFFIGVMSNMHLPN